MSERMSPLWTSQEIAAVVDAPVSGDAFEASGLCIDTRTISPGDLFVALTGERDGNAYAQAAFAGGAAGALTSRPVEGGPFIQVADTLSALERLGVAARERAPARRCAVTGSVGKTSVTQAIAAALKLTGPSHAPVKSFNNHIGVPLTLARMPRETQRAVFEIGMNHAGEIGPLSRLVAPHVCVVTTVGPVHTENFADGEAGVARAKAEIFEGLEPGGAAVLNVDDKWFDLLADAARARGARVLSFGRGDGCDAQLLGFERDAPSTPLRGVPLTRHAGEEKSLLPWEAGELSAQPTEGACITARLHGRLIRFPIAQSGAHWGPNSLATLLALEALDVSLATGLEALATFAPLQGRGAERAVATAGGSFVLIDESYNANPVSMRAAISTLGARPAVGRRIAVLTDMLELGAEAERHHADLAQSLEEAGVDLVFCAGPLMAALWDGLPASRRSGYAKSAEALGPKVVAAVRPGDIVMIKGSNGSKASSVVSALEAAAKARSAVAAEGAR